MTTEPDPTFLALVRTHEEALLRAARLLTGDWDDAEELLRSTLAWALSVWPVLCEQGSAPLRVRQRMIVVFLGAHSDRPADEDDDDSAAENRLADLDLGGSLVESLGVLTAKDRAIVVSRYYLGLSAAEIAEALGLDDDDVATTAVRVLAALRWSA